MPHYREPTLEDAMQTIARQAMRISHLEDDNLALRAQLDHHRSALNRASQGADTGNLTRHVVHNDMFSAVELEHSSSLTRELADLKGKFDRLSSEHKQCAPRVREALSKYREAKQRVREWKAYLDGKKYVPGEHDSIDRMPSLPPVPPVPQKTDIKVEDAPDLEDCNMLPFTHTTRALRGPDLHATNVIASSEAMSSPPASSPRFRIAGITSSQTTVEGMEDLGGMASASDLRTDLDDMPVVVSARSLKRKATAPAFPGMHSRRIKQEPQYPSAQVEISSDGHIVDNPQRQLESFSRTETSDLDTLGSVISTPSRRHCAGDPHGRAASVKPARSVPGLARNVSTLSEGDLGVRLGVPSGRGPDAHRNGVSLGRGGSADRPDTANNASPAVLQPISVNLPTIHSPAKEQPDIKPSVRRHGKGEEAMLLSEDGDFDSSQAEDATPQNRKHCEGPVLSIDVDRRLGDMVREPTREKSPVLRRKAVEAITTARRCHSPLQLPTPGSPVKKPPSAECKSPPRRPQPSRSSTSPPPVRPEDEPLRLQHVQHMRLEDFRINPKYLGSDLAFADTLRGRDARRGLHVCERPGCCGAAFEKAVTMAGPTVSGKTDAQALEVFLGPTWIEQLGGFAPEKRKEVVTQAHVYCFSNQHGKHREAFARRKTPPGFWDTDFPTTQETAEHRKQAREMEQRTIEERYREAMREGGRWRFRDE